MPQLYESNKGSPAGLLPHQVSPGASQGNGIGGLPQGALTVGNCVGFFGTQTGNTAIPVYELSRAEISPINPAEIQPAQVSSNVPESPEKVTIGWDEIEELYRNYGTKLLRIAGMHTSNYEDAQDVFANSLLRLNGKTLRDADAIAGYARTIIANNSNDLYQNNKAVRCTLQTNDLPAESAESVVISHDEQRAVVLALMRLPPRQREVMVLRYYDDLSEAEIAGAMGISRGAVKSHAARAISNLRDELT